MQYAEERLTLTNQPELETLVRDYYACTPANTDLPPYAFNWPMYELMQQAGMLMVCTARDSEERLAGFSLYVCMDHLHHMGWHVADCDTLAVDHRRRGQGIGGELLEFSVQQAKLRGAKMVTNRARTCYDAAPLFEKHGFTLAEQVYMRKL